MFVRKKNIVKKMIVTKMSILAFCTIPAFIAECVFVCVVGGGYGRGSLSLIMFVNVSLQTETHHM